MVPLRSRTQTNGIREHVESVMTHAVAQTPITIMSSIRLRLMPPSPLVHFKIGLQNALRLATKKTLAKFQGQKTD